MRNKMTEKTIDNYMSVEQKILESEPVKFLAKFTGSAFSAAISYLKIPTFIRKYNEKQTLLQRDNHIYNYMGSATGTIMGFVGGSAEIVESLKDGNYVPALVFLGLNAVCGIYESGRKDGKKVGAKEGLEAR